MPKALVVAGSLNSLCEEDYEVEERRMLGRRRRKSNWEEPGTQVRRRMLRRGDAP